MKEIQLKSILVPVSEGSSYHIWSRLYYLEVEGSGLISGNLSKVVFDRRRSTGSRFFTFLSSGFAQIFS